MGEPEKMQERLFAAFDRQVDSRPQPTPTDLPFDDDLDRAAAERAAASGMLRRLSFITVGAASLALALGAWSGSFVYSATLAGFMAAIALGCVFQLRGGGVLPAPYRARRVFRDRDASVDKPMPLRRREDVLARIGEVHDALGDVAIVRDLDGRILVANETFRRLTACLSPVGLRCDDLGLAFTQTSVPDTLEVEFATAFDRRIFAWRDVIVRDPVTGVQLRQSIGRDITLERQRESEGAESRTATQADNAAKSELLATASHEIRTPLNGILGMGHLLAQTPLTAVQRNYLDGIRQSGQALAQLVNDLLDFSTREAGRLSAHPVAAAPRTLIEGVVEMLSHRAHEKGIELAMAVSPLVPRMLEFDAARLRQALFNVIGNAVKFTESGGVLVEATWLDGDLIIDVVDTGPGMSEDEQQRIFEAFAQAGSPSQKSGGTGLGLAISAQILRDFGGALTVASERGRGSTFTIRLPAAIDKATGPEPDRSRQLAGRTVLLLAPQGPSAWAISQTVAMLGGSCQRVESGDEALMHFNRLQHAGQRYTDVIVDHRLAAEFAHHMAARLDHAGDPPRRIVLVNPEARADPMQGRFDAWLIRPLREKTLIDVLLGRLHGIEKPRAPSMETPESFDGHVPTGNRASLFAIVADDDPINRLLTQSVLRRAGHEVLAVADFSVLRDAVLAPQSRHPDVIVTDMHMPGGDGISLVREIRARERQSGRVAVPFVVLTGDSSSAVRQAVLESGADRLLVKPVTPTTLLQTVEDVAYDRHQLVPTI